MPSARMRVQQGDDAREDDRCRGGLVRLLGLLLCVSACTGPRQLHPSDRDTYDDALREAQVYVSTRAILSRLVLDTGADVAADHVLVTSQDATIEEVEIGAKTPGVIIGFEGAVLLVSFEPPIDGKERFLRFVPYSGLYVLGSEPGSLPDGTRVGAEESMVSVISAVSLIPRAKPAALPVLSVVYDERPFLLGKFNIATDPWPLDPNPRVSSFAPFAVPHLLVSSQHMDELEKRSRSLPGRTLPLPALEAR